MKETVNKLIEQMQTLLSKMTPSQRMSLGMLSLVVVVSLITLAIWSGDAQGSSHVTILYGIDGEKADHVTALFAERGITFRIAANEIAVPREMETRARAVLGGDPVFQKKNMWAFLYQSDITGTNKQQNMRHLDAVRLTIRDVIMGWSGVLDAQVIITPAETNRFVYAPNRRRTASVDVTMEYGEELNPNQVRSIARVLSGAVTLLKPKDVQIVSNGKVYDLAELSDDTQGLGQRHSLQEKVAQNIAGNIHRVLNTIYSQTTEIVSVQLDMKEDHINAYEKALAGVVSTSETEERETNTKGQPGAPGVEPNTEVLANGQSSVGGGSSERNSKSKVFSTQINNPNAGSERESWKTVADNLEKIRISVVVPYAEAIMDKMGNVPEEEADRDALITKNLDEVKNMVAGVVPFDVKDQIFVTAGRFRVPEPITQQSSALGTVGFLAKEYGGSALLAVFALTALMMISSMIKKSIPAPVVQTLTDTGSLTGDDDDEDQYDDEEILEILNAEVPEHQKAEVYKRRIHQAVEEDVQVAAELVKRWLAKEA